MIPEGSDKSGHSMRMLLQFAIAQFPRESVFDFVTDKDKLVGVMAAQRLQTNAQWADQTYGFAVELSHNTKAWYRELAAFILGQLCPPDYPYKDKSIATLQTLACDREAAVRGAAIVGLGHLHSESSKHIILEALNDSDPGVVDSASFALWCVGRSSSDLETLHAAIQRFDPKTRAMIDPWED